MENFQPLVTVCATHALLEQNNLVHLAKHALQVSLVVAKQIPHVKIARKVFTKTSQDSRTVCHVCPVNSMVMPVLINAKLAQKTPFQVRKTGPCPAINVPLVVPANKAVLNVPIVHPVRSKTGSTANAIRVQRDGTRWNWMLRCVHHVFKGKLLWLGSHAIRATLDVLVAQKVFAMTVWRAGISRTKARPLVWIVLMESSTKHDRLALIAMLANEVVRHWARACNVKMARFKVKKVKPRAAPVKTDSYPTKHKQLVNGHGTKYQATANRVNI